MNKLTELDLIKRCQSGELECFGELYELYVEKIYNFIYYRVSHKETAEDLTSQVFTKALYKISEFNLELGYFSAWLYRISRNIVIDHYRTKKDTSDIETQKDLKSENNLEHEIEIKYNLDKVEKYLENLTPEQKEIVIMRVWDELSYEEISKIVGKSKENCKVIFSRVIAKIRKESLLAFILLVSKMIFK